MILRFSLFFLLINLAWNFTIALTKNRLEEAEFNAVKGGRKIIEKLEAKVKQLNSELDMENKFKADLNTKYTKVCFT